MLFKWKPGWINCGRCEYVQQVPFDSSDGASELQRNQHDHATKMIITGIVANHFEGSARDVVKAAEEIMRIVKKRGYVAQINHCNQLLDGTNC